MHKTKRKVFLVALVIFSLVTMSGALPMVSTVKAASMDTAKDTISDSAPSVASSTHTIVVNLATALVADQYFSIDFGSFTGDVEANVSCPANTTASSTPNSEVGCEATGAVSSTTDQTITVSGVTSPAAGSYSVWVRTYQSNGTEIENAEVKVYIIDSVTVTARVNASLTFGVAAVDADQTVNTELTTTATTTATSIPFGTLDAASDAIAAQQLTVSTNASNGFTVTVQQDGELTSAAGATINSFDNNADGTGSTSAHAWNTAAGTLGTDSTYGHLGVTSDDENLVSAYAEQDFDADNHGGSAWYAGLNGTAALPVMHHDGPADGSTQNAGLARVAYRADITNLQEAGDYTSTLTYVCTPTY